MQRIYSYKENKGILYLVATPIGNLEDITIRALNVLKEIDIIYAEDTRNSSILLKHFDIQKPMYSYHNFNEELKCDEIIGHLKDGKNIAIISDAGLPVISDPGFEIAKVAIENNIPVTTIPGPSAGISALVSSGLNPLPYTFIGFLDSKSAKRKKELEEYKYYKHTIIFYEAPHRIIDTLKDILEVLGNRHIVIARELTKMYEEYIRGNVKDILDSNPELKGEMVLLVDGYKEVNENGNPLLEIKALIEKGYRLKDAVKDVALMHNLNKQELYKQYIDEIKD